MYGPEFPIFAPNYLKARVLPRLLSQRTEMARYWSGTWRVSKAKRATSRAVFSQQHNLAHCFTVECSNGHYYVHQQNSEFGTAEWLAVGRHIGEALADLVRMTLAYEQYEEERRHRAKRKSAMKRQWSEEEMRAEKTAVKHAVKHKAPQRPRRAKKAEQVPPELLRMLA